MKKLLCALVPSVFISSSTLKHRERCSPQNLRSGRHPVGDTLFGPGLTRRPQPGGGTDSVEYRVFYRARELGSASRGL